MFSIAQCPQCPKQPLVASNRMTSFSWKRKSKLETSSATVFSEEAGDEEELDEMDWLRPTKRLCLSSLEDGKVKSKRLLSEGAALAESERYWEAIKYWDEAIQFTPGVAAIHEMKSQVYT